ncbi:MAG: AraC family transcriptional regulator [Leptospirales bacterium]|nr:AraC family transcriptional regulator [Leptospirales bacterium]
MDHWEYAAWLFAGGIFALNWALGLVFTGKKTPGLTGISAAMLFCTAIWLFSAAALLGGYVQRYPALFGLHLPFAFAIGPLLYAYAASLRGEKPIAWVHSIVPLVSILALIPYHAGWSSSVGSGNLDRFYFHVNGIIKVALLTYLAVASIKTARLIPQDKRFLPLFAFYVITMFVLFLGLLGYILSLAGLVALSALLLPLLLFALFLASCRWPDLLGSLRSEIQKRKYEKSRLLSLDVKGTISSLQHLMEVERAYSDEDLTLSSLARDLEISAPQLSEILNLHIQKSFAHYVNEYRVKEARTLIEQESDRTLLSIAHAVGFNSKSSFNRAFKLFTGETAQEFKTSIALFQGIKS